MNQLTEVKAKQVKVITAAFGPHANLRQLKDVNGGADVLHFQVEEKESFKFFGKELLHSKCPKNIRQSFQKHAYAYLELAQYSIICNYLYMLKANTHKLL